MPAQAAFAAVLRRCALPALAALLLAALAARAGRPAADLGPAAAVPLLLWLHLPCAVVAAAAVIATLESWPMFGRDRAGSALVRRLTHSALAGCGVAAAGGALAGALLLAAAGAAFALVARTLAAEIAPPRAYDRAVVQPGAATLDASHPRIELQATGAVADAIRLNPLAVLARGGTLAPVELTLAVDGEPLADRCTIAANGEQVLVRLPAPRAVHRIAIERRSAPSLALLFPPGSVQVRRAAAHALAANLALAAACYAAPILLALLLATALRTVLGWPALLTVALAGVGIAAVGELTPAGAALTASARGRFLASEPLSWRPAALAAIALLGGALLPAGLDRLRGGRR